VFLLQNSSHLGPWVAREFDLYGTQPAAALVGDENVHSIASVAPGTDHPQFAAAIDLALSTFSDIAAHVRFRG
jgi:hypothetical protein